MKVSKKTGKIKLDFGELVIDDRYFVKREFEHMRISDMNLVFHVRVSRRTTAGAWLENRWRRASDGDDSAMKTLKTYAATLWSILTVAPDDAFINETLEAVDGALNRHPDWYGLKDEEEKQDEGQD